MVLHYLYIVFSVWLFIGLSHNLAGLQIQQPQRHVTSGEARLWINVASGLPFRREGTLRIDAGVVNVVEFYGFSR